MRELIANSCIVEGCGKPACNSRGWCNSHYWRWRKHGDPTAGRTAEHEPRKFLETAISYEREDCLIWPFARTKFGYGVISVNGQAKIVSKIVCEATHGAAPTPKHQAAHLCGKGNLGCVSPMHLEWKTPIENGLDRVIHGSLPIGEKNKGAKLTERDVIQIRDRRKSGETLALLARQFGVSLSLIGLICQRKLWTHI